MPKVGAHTGPSNAGSAAANARARAEAAAEARRVERTQKLAAQAARYDMSRREVDRHHADLRWVLETAIAHAVAGDDEMADFTIRHAIHAGIPVVTLAGALADVGAMRPRAGG